MRIEQLSLAAAAFARRGIVVLHQDNDRIDAALRDAKARGLTDDDDCIAFATRVVVDGTGFTAHPDPPGLVRTRAHRRHSVRRRRRIGLSDNAVARPHGAPSCLSAPA